MAVPASQLGCLSLAHSRQQETRGAYLLVTRVVALYHVFVQRREATRSATPSKAPLFPRRPEGGRDRSGSLTGERGEAGGIAHVPVAPSTASTVSSDDVYVHSGTRRLYSARRLPVGTIVCLTHAPPHVYPLLFPPFPIHSPSWRSNGPRVCVSFSHSFFAFAPPPPLFPRPLPVGSCDVHWFGVRCRCCRVCVCVVPSGLGASAPGAMSPRVKRTLAATRMRVNVSLGMDAAAPVSRTPKEPHRRTSNLVPRR